MKKRIYILLSMALLLLTQTGCIYDKGAVMPCSSEKTEALVIKLNLTVPSSSTGTRSADENHLLVPGSDDENYINIDDEDYQVLMFDRDGALVEGKLSEFKCEKNGVSDESVSYTLTAHLTLTNNQDREALSTFKVMVLANWKSFERSNTRPNYDTYPTFTGYNITPNAEKNIFKDKENFNFTLNKPSDNFSWVPSIDKKQAIPMFGVTDDLDLQFVMDMSKYGDGPSFNVPMLRAMAKVEIIDESGEKISSVSMSSANQSGRIIPEIDESTNTGWSDPNTQIKTPSIPTNPGKIDKIQFVQGPDSDGKRTWVAYIPEMDFRGIDESQRPQFTVYDETTELDPKPFNNYEDGEVVTAPEKYLPAVLRNHIYSFRATITDKAKVLMELQVLPWEMEYDDTPSYFDSPEVAGWLEWKTVYVEGDVEDEEKIGQPNDFLDDDEKLILTMKSTTDEYAQATFTLKAPKNCRWYAQLQSLGGDSNAFYFVDKDGEPISTNNGNPGGIIGEESDNCIVDNEGNTKCTIRIKNNSVKVYNHPNEAKLMVFVEYPDKTNREVKVVEGKMVYGDDDSIGKWVDNYTIYQAQTDIYD